MQPHHQMAGFPGPSRVVITGFPGPQRVSIVGELALSTVTLGTCGIVALLALGVGVYVGYKVGK